MKLKFSSKSQEFETDGTVKGTKVLLMNSEGALYPVMLPADKINLSNEELESLAKDVIYQENFRDKYENEKFSAYDDTIEQLQKSVDDTEKMMKTATGALNDLIDKLCSYEDSANETSTKN